MATELIKKYPNHFKPDDFNFNKEKVSELANISSKLARNKVAGYITHHLGRKNKKTTSQPTSE